MKTWEITIKEKGNDVLLKTSYTTQDDNTSFVREFIIWFFGLNEPDVEWYHIEEPKEVTLKCCICGKEINGHGNNPYPVKDDGRCCAECNATVVIPERIKLFTNKTFKL